MATYNGENYIREQLESLAGQTRRPDEIIISDDGSSDKTLAIIEATVSSSSMSYRLMRHETRRGYTRNFITAAEAATGDLIVFCDQDDVWHPEKLEVLAGRAVASEKRVFYHDFAVVFDDGRPPIPSYHRHLRAAGYEIDVCVKGCSCAVKRSFLTEWGWPLSEPTITYDLWLALLSSASRDRETIDAVLIDHRIHATNTSGWLLGEQSRRPDPAYTARFPGPGSLIDLCMQRHNIQGWKRILSDFTHRPSAMAFDADAIEALVAIKGIEITRPA